MTIFSLVQEIAGEDASVTRHGLWLLLMMTSISAGDLAAQSTLPPAKTGSAIPTALEGTWYISLCVEPGHCWLRYQHEKTGEVHTLGRFEKGSGGRVSLDGTRLHPKADESGLRWDHDLFEEPWIAKGKFLLLTTKQTNPAIHLGKDGGRGYQALTNNCVHFVRDAWAFHSGEHYSLRLVPTPTTFAEEVGKRHPSIPLTERLRRN